MKCFEQIAVTDMKFHTLNSEALTTMILRSPFRIYGYGYNLMLALSEHLSMTGQILLFIQNSYLFKPFLESI